jgi:hypothetical protein
MAQSHAKRNRRAKRAARPSPTPATRRRNTRIRRIVIAFMILVALAGILAVTGPDDAGSGAPIGSRSGVDGAR